MRTFKVMPGRSDVIRNHAERAVLELFNARMAAVSLSGYIFFGSSVSISDKVQPLAANQTASPPAWCQAGLQLQSVALEHGRTVSRQERSGRHGQPCPAVSGQPTKLPSA